MSYRLSLSRAALLTGCCLAAAVAPVATAAPSAPPADSPAVRADAATALLIDRFWDTDRRWWRAQDPDDGKTAGYWTAAQALEAVLDGAARTDGDPAPRRALATRVLEGMIRNRDAGKNWKVGFFDDECWMGVALVRVHTLGLSPRGQALSRAWDLREDIHDNGWTTNTTGVQGRALGPLRKGVWWDRDHTQFATASNPGAALLECRLWAAEGRSGPERRGRGTHVAPPFAREVYANWRESMTDKATSQVFDHVTTAGAVVKWSFTYNESLMAAVAAQLSVDHRGVRSNLQGMYEGDAAGYARRLLDTKAARDGVLSDGDATACTGDCHQFKGAAIRHLAAVRAVLSESTQPGRRETARRIGLMIHTSADAAWTLARAPGSGRFGVDWSGPPPAAGTTVTLAQTSAAVAVLQAAAAIAAEPARTPALP